MQLQDTRGQSDVLTDPTGRTTHSQDLNPQEVMRGREISFWRGVCTRGTRTAEGLTGLRARPAIGFPAIRQKRIISRSEIGPNHRAEPCRNETTPRLLRRQIEQPRSNRRRNIVGCVHRLELYVEKWHEIPLSRHPLRTSNWRIDPP